MALNDFTVLQAGPFGARGTVRWAVAANASGQGTVAAGTYVSAFRPGELALRTAGAVTVTPLYTTAASGTTIPVAGTDIIVGIAVGPKTSTETDAAAGYVDLMPIDQWTILLGTPDAVATWNTQAKYDALTGKRVLIHLTAGGYCAGSYTLYASDGSTYACVIMPLDISKFPGKVAFAIRATSLDLTA